jgi:hypothetical protein
MIDMPKPIEVKALPGYKIWLRFSDSSSGEVDLKHLKKMDAFKVWNDAGNFEKVFIADNGRCIAWNDELELCPNALYLDVIKKTYEEYAPFV